MVAYKAIPAPERLLADLAELHLGHGDLPAVDVPVDDSPQGPPDDLVAETDADNAHPVLLEQGPPRVLREVVYPRYLVECVVLFKN